MTDTKQAPREFWIDFATRYGDPCDFISSERHKNPSATNIHVIEYKAYEAEKQKVEQLQAELDKANEALKVLKDAVKIPEMDCGDNSCRFADRSKPMGMRTNGGCRCLEKSGSRIQILRFLFGAREALSKCNELLGVKK